MMTSNKVRDIMTSEVETCTLLDNVYEVAVKMKDYNVGSIPIVDKDKIVGVITDRDIVIRGVAEKHPGSTKVEDIMSTDLVTVSPESTLDEVSQLMSKHQVRRLPVVEGNQLVGIVALGDLAVHEGLDEESYVALEQISESDTTN